METNKTGLNRTMRRRMRAHAGALAEQHSRATIEYTESGNRVKVSGPRAVEALRRALQLMFVNGGEPQLIRIASLTAREFPRSAKVKTPEGAVWWLAVGLDVCGVPTFVVRWLIFDQALKPFAERRAAEAVIFGELDEQLGRAGLPVRGSE